MTGSVQVGLVGTGIVGLNVARELCGLDSSLRVALLSGTPARRETIAGALGTQVIEQGGEAEACDVVVLATPDDQQVARLPGLLAAGVHVVCTADAPLSIDQLLAFQDDAIDARRSVVIGAAMSPGVTSLLAAHAATLFDRVTEIDIAVSGTAGPACRARRRNAMSGSTMERRDGDWAEARSGSSRELVWFPDPVGAQECEKASLSDPRVIDRVVPDLAQLTVRAVRTDAKRTLRHPPTDPLGAVRVEVRGMRDGGSATTVYGMVDRPGAVTGALAAAIVPLLVEGTPAGVMGPAELGQTTRPLRWLKSRGLKPATFEP